MGMNGTTSVAPILGCAPGVVRQFYQFGGFAHSVKDRFGHGFGSPASVTTSGCDPRRFSRSSTRTPTRRA